MVARSSKESFVPPDTRTMPLGSRVAACLKRPVDRSPVGVHVSVSGEKTKVVPRAEKSAESPPTRRTLPSLKVVVVWLDRPDGRPVVVVQVPAIGSKISQLLVGGSIGFVNPAETRTRPSSRSDEAWSLWGPFIGGVGAQDPDIGSKDNCGIGGVVEESRLIRRPATRDKDFAICEESCGVPIKGFG